MTNKKYKIAVFAGDGVGPEIMNEAIKVLKAAVTRDRESPFAWYQLGVAYAAQGDTPRAQLASAEQQVMERRYPEALQNATAALTGLPENTPDWLRAQDITMQARAELEGKKKKRKSKHNG